MLRLFIHHRLLPACLSIPCPEEFWSRTHLPQPQAQPSPISSSRINYFFLLDLKKNNESHCQLHSPFYYSPVCLWISSWIVKFALYNILSMLTKMKYLGGGIGGILIFWVRNLVNSWLLFFAGFSPQILLSFPLKNVSNSSPHCKPHSHCLTWWHHHSLLQDSSASPAVYPLHRNFEDHQWRSARTLLTACLSHSVAFHYPEDKV